MLEIIDHFEIAGRGTVVVVDKPAVVRSGIRLSVLVTQTDGSTVLYEAWKESLRGKESTDAHSDSFLLVGAHIDSVPIGAIITVV